MQGISQLPEDLLASQEDSGIWCRVSSLVVHKLVGWLYKFLGFHTGYCSNCGFWVFIWHRMSHTTLQHVPA
jgi:hypothetical protein